ncbi:uncharacterized protein G2W53_030919 [Senna tora]|uniref:Uncharacterized protein n=1 Tax=Senna tora TaxID=362788 RepID=A0A834WB89_9FABA|nr:uncharacterized protein G2W53_030919 [Senna tora]
MKTNKKAERIEKYDRVSNLGRFSIWRSKEPRKCRIISELKTPLKGKRKVNASLQPYGVL